MCQLCTLTPLTTSARWPKPLESSIADLQFLITCAHDQHAEWQATLTKPNNTPSTTNKPNIPANGQSTAPPPPPSLLSLLRTLSASLTSLSHERSAWWKSKTPLIKQLKAEESGTSEKKLMELQKINNSAVDRIEGMEAKLGGCVRWSLGMRGGVWELVALGRVQDGEGVDGL